MKSAEEVFTKEVERLDREFPGWDNDGRIAATKTLLKEGVSREALVFTYGENIVKKVEAAMKNDELGTRMKGYEAIPQIYLTPRMPFIIRIDGKAFHTFTKGYEKPWDLCLVEAMTGAAKALMAEIQGSKLAYIQSDEISILCTDYETFTTQAWFGKKVQKICSVSASIATAAFNASLMCSDAPMVSKPFMATFDSRCFAIPKEEVCNCLIWRQQDAVRNSIQGMGQKHFSHKELHQKNTNQIQEMLFQEHGINWNDLETWKKRGWCVLRKTEEKEEGIIRTIIEPDWDIPKFTEDREYVEKYL